jgi:ABC-type antimicrobial peptide transport system permease subunit
MDDLQPGDKVVELGAMVRSVTIATGAISLALLLFLAKQSLSVCLAGFFIGAVSGLIIGLIISRLLHSDGKGNVNIVKALPENIPVTLSAAFKGALVQTVFVLVAFGLMGKIVSWPVAVFAASGVNLLTAFVIARGSLS